MKSIFLITLSITLLIIAFSVAYYFLFFLPNQEKVRRELELKKTELQTKTTFDSCYEKCVKLGYPPTNNTCGPETHLGTGKTDVPGTSYKAGDPWCFINEGFCIRACKTAE
ncbi:hypothetical protein HY439_00765 [Candidatus Microgenomates bacterium]|nr:hypothetical protein [Candidatus Microgenomates bacterium]